MSRMVLGADSLMDMKLRTGEVAMGAVCCIGARFTFRIGETTHVEGC